MENDKPKRGIASLLSPNTTPTSSSDKSNTEASKATEIEKNWVRVGVLMYPKDHEKYKDFFWFMKNKHSSWGHKEVQEHLMELVEKTYGKIPERTDEERLSEERKSSAKKK